MNAQIHYLICITFEYLFLMVRRRLGTRRVLLKAWYCVKDKDHSWVQKRVIAKLERVPWKCLNQYCRTNAALVRYVWQRALGTRDVGKCLRTVHYPCPVQDQYGRWDIQIHIPGLGWQFWHIVLFFFFYSRKWDF